MGHLFQHGFGEYLESGDFSDLELVTERCTYRVHRLLLIYSSEFFASLLTSEFKEKGSSSIELKFEDPEDLFPQVLEFIYKDKINITEDNAIPLLAIADNYLITALRQKASDFICNHIHRDNVLSILHNSLSFNVQEITNKCLSIVAKNFCRFQEKTDWKFLPPDAFCRLLQEEYLTIKDEYSLYQLVHKYISAHKSDVSQEHVERLMECIRFRWMSYDELEEIKHDDMVPSSLFIEAIMARLLQIEDPERLKKKEQKITRLRPRASFGMQFEYSEDPNQRGIIYWIGTCGRTRSYTNPHPVKVTVSASSLYKGYEGLLLSLQPAELWTEDVPASWFCIDLGENRTVLPTYYTLRHGGKHKSDFLRTWDFQGSIDGREWTLLRRHNNDLSFKEPFQSCTWSIQTNTPYQKFRVLQTGHSSGNRNFLLLSGIELYGDLYEFKHERHSECPHKLEDNN